MTALEPGRRRLDVPGSTGNSATGETVARVGTMHGSDLDALRRRVLAASLRPAWVDAVIAVGFGLSLGVLSAQVLWSWALGAVLLVASIVLSVGLTRSFATRRDEPGSGLADRRSALVFLAMFAAVYLLGMLDGPRGWQPEWMLAYAMALSAVGYAYLRLVERFTVDRLARSGSPAGSVEEDEVRGALYESLYQVAALERDVLVRGLGVPEAALDQHLSELEAAGHLRVQRRGHGHRERTWLSLTVPGRQATTAGR